MSDIPQKKPRNTADPAPWKRPIAMTEDFHDRHGNSIYQEVKFADGRDPRFLLRRQDPSSKTGWRWNIKGMQRELFQLLQLIKDMAEDAVILLPEGPKDCRTLYKFGFAATTNAMGAKNWIEHYSETLRDARVCILPDNDEAGEDHLRTVGQALTGYARSIRVLRLPDLPDKGDVSDFLTSPEKADQLERLMAEAPEWEANNGNIFPTIGSDPDNAGGPEADLLQTPISFSPAVEDGAPTGSTALLEANFSDDGNAERFKEFAGGNFRYCYARKSWLRWNGRRWSWCESGEEMGQAKALIRKLYTVGAEIGNDKQRAAFQRSVVGLESVNRKSAMLESARDLLPVRLDDLDSNPFLFNVANGTLDLETGALREPEQSDMMTKASDVPFDPEAQCPVFEKFLVRIFNDNEETIAFFQRAVGYTLTGSCEEEVVFILYGVGANGKSTALEGALRPILGDYAGNADFSTFLKSRNENPRYDIARLAGKRFITAVESEADKTLSEAVIKRLSGGDLITARNPYERAFEFTMLGKIWLATNHKPKVRENIEAIWRRIRLIPFNIVIPEAERDHKLRDKLRDELSGILAWAVRGCVKWQRNGLGTAGEVSQATADYRAETDTIGSFLHDGDYIVLNDHANVYHSFLHGEYSKWCGENEEEGVSSKALSLYLHQQGYESERPQNRLRWSGIALVEINRRGKEAG